MSLLASLDFTPLVRIPARLPNHAPKSVKVASIDRRVNWHPIMLRFIAFTCLICCYSMHAQTNLALGRPAGASSFCGSGCSGGPYGPTLAVDGNLSTSWIAQNSQFPQWLVVDLGAIYNLSSVTQTFNNSDTWYYKIEGSNDNAATDDTQWAVLANHSSGTTGQTLSDSVSGNYRYVRLYVTNAGGNWATSKEFQVSGTLLSQPTGIVPTPSPISTGNYLVGAQMCNFWDNSHFWPYIAVLPPNIPLLGYYNEAYDVAVDWQIKMAADHGIGFFMPCWFRMANNAGQAPVLSTYDELINSIANTAQHRSYMKWAIAWILDNSAGSGTNSVNDFVQNVVPFWINNYFSKSNYIKINGKPVVSLYNAAEFISQVGGLSNANQALSGARQAAIAAGYSGIIFMAVNNQSTTAANSDASSAGFDYMYAYNIPTFTELMTSTTPSDSTVISWEQQAWSNWNTYSAVPTIVTASVGWNGIPWGWNADYFQLTPADYSTLLSDAKTAMAARSSSLQNEMLLLDNWDEFAEGHFIEPTQQYGYGYLDAIASVFSPGSTPSDPLPDISAVPQVISPVFEISSVHSGKAVSLTGAPSDPNSDGDPVIQWSYISSDLQQWKLDPGPIGYFYIRSVHSNDDISAAGGYSQSQLGVPIQQYHNVSSTLQQWQPVLKPGTSQFSLILNWDSQAMSLANSDPAALQDGDPIQTYTFFGSDAQLWNFSLISY